MTNKPGVSVITQKVIPELKQSLLSFQQSLVPCSDFSAIQDLTLQSEQFTNISKSLKTIDWQTLPTPLFAELVCIVEISLRVLKQNMGERFNSGQYSYLDKTLQTQVSSQHSINHSINETSQYPAINSYYPIIYQAYKASKLLEFLLQAYVNSEHKLHYFYQHTPFNILLVSSYNTLYKATLCHNNDYSDLKGIDLKVISNNDFDSNQLAKKIIQYAGIDNFQAAVSTNTKLTSVQKQQLSLVWRHSTLEVVNVDNNKQLKNNETALIKLRQVAQRMQSDALAREDLLVASIWIVADYWFDSLILHHTSMSFNVYTAVLANLDGLIANFSKGSHAGFINSIDTKFNGTKFKYTNFNDTKFDFYKHYKYQSKTPPHNQNGMNSNLLVDVTISLLSLEKFSDDTKALIERLLNCPIEQNRHNGIKTKHSVVNQMYDDKSNKKIRGTTKNNGAIVNGDIDMDDFNAGNSKSNPNNSYGFLISPKNNAINLDDIVTSSAQHHEELHEAQTEKNVADAAKARIKEDHFDMYDSIYEVFFEEVNEILEVLEATLPEWQAEPQFQDDLTLIRRVFHTLKGSARIVGANAIGELAWATEELLNKVRDGLVPATQQVISFVIEVKQVLNIMVDDYANKQQPSVNPLVLILKANNLSKARPINFAMHLITKIDANTGEPINQLKSQLTRKLGDSNQPFNDFNKANEVDDSHNISKNINNSDLGNAHALSDATYLTDSHKDNVNIKVAQSNITNKNEEEQATASIVFNNKASLSASNESTKNSIEQVVTTDNHKISPDEVNLPHYSHTEDIKTDPELLEIFLEEAEEIEEQITIEFNSWAHNPCDKSALKALQRHLHTIKGGARMSGISSIGDLTHQAETLYEQLLDDKIHPSAGWVTLMQSVQDTLSEQIDYAVSQHKSFFANEMVTQLKQLSIDKELPSDFKLVKPKLLDGQKELKPQPQPQSQSQNQQCAQKTDKDEPSENKQLGLANSQITTQPNLMPECIVESKLSNTLLYNQDISQIPDSKGYLFEAEDKSTNNEMIRVSANLVDKLIKLSSESLINRVHIDSGLGDINKTVEEMATTIKHLNKQVKHLDVELETRHLNLDNNASFKSHPIGINTGDHTNGNVQESHTDNPNFKNPQFNDANNSGPKFDALEMDQYSSFSYLAKSLSESASDLLEFKQLLFDQSRQTVDLLRKLSRHQNELHEGLMHFRMVPFSGILPRLQRVVRQTANELNKQADLVVMNADENIDRTILNSIIAPLEHMLRNAVDHGIETPEVRKQQGKPPTGSIEVTLAHKGDEIILTVKDDGKGIDVDTVRRKVINLGLIEANDNNLSDIDVMQYIFYAGLTTTDKITQISGRGVGMDVVMTQVRQLGGSILVDSAKSAGSTFTMCIPLTMATADALMVRVADNHYAIPLAQVQRIEQISVVELTKLYQAKCNQITINNKSYRLNYLNQILNVASIFENHPLNGEKLNSIIKTEKSPNLPVILLKDINGQNHAIQVDEITGSRVEIVLRALGPQLSHIAGLSGVTTLGDGSVMFVLDVPALIKNAFETTIQNEVSLQARIPQTRHEKVNILIVDDSVTVRKVTSRLLERQGYETSLAKDGIEAIKSLQQKLPDLMLLDIEMPRMDGFEVVHHLRHNSDGECLRELPIIMISSRAGDRHRNRAFELGVNEFMSKPFSQNVLLNSIENLL